MDQTSIMTAADQVAYLRDDKNVSFNLVTESDAVTFLEERNFFFKVKAFAKDFEKYVEKPGDKGRYVNLDFGQLVELSHLDSVLRALVLELALDVEHYLKVRINMAAMSCGNDPYAIVESFLEKSATQVIAEQEKSLDMGTAEAAMRSAHSLLDDFGEDASPEDYVGAANAAIQVLSTVTGGRDPHHIENAMTEMQGSPYSGKLVTKYVGKSVPLWVMLELVSFGSLIKLYRYCFDKDGVIGDPCERAMFDRNKALLRCTQQLRNAAAHNDCLLNGLALHEKRKGAHGAVRRALASSYGMSDDLIAPVSSVRVAMDVAALLMCYDAYVPRNCGSRRRASEALSISAERFAEHATWFSKSYDVDVFIAYAVQLFRTFSGVLA